MNPTSSTERQMGNFTKNEREEVRKMIGKLPKHKKIPQQFQQKGKEFIRNQKGNS